MKLTFYGATRQVTGSCTLIETDKTRVLVDCGLFQGGALSYEKNLEKFPFDPSSIDALIVTHAHIDHIGRIPKLVKDGFRGRIFATHPTRQLSDIMWHDAARVMKTDAWRYGRPRMYKARDIAPAYDQMHGMKYGTSVRVSGDVSCIFREAGHIFGSAFAELDVGGTKLVMSGDIGNDHVPILRQTSNIVDCDMVVMESTYGDRLHEDPTTRVERLREVVQDTIDKKGVLLVPAFSLERTQEILYELNSLVESGRFPKVPIFLDSPLAIRVLPVYRKFPEYYDQEAKELKNAGDDFFRFPGLNITKKQSESEKIRGVAPPKVIIAGSGMMHGGRIMSHLVDYLNSPRTTVLVVGYQAAGTLGRAVVEGANRVVIDDEEIIMRASVEVIGAYSAHGDQKKLLQWVSSGKRMPEHIYLNHGEPHSVEVLGEHIRKLFGTPVTIPEFGETYEH